MDTVKTIFITSFHGLVSRVLECGVLAELQRSKAVRVVIFVPDFKKEYFKEVFGDRKETVIAGIGMNFLTRRAHYFHQLSFMLLDTGTMYLIRKTYRGYRHKPVRRFFVQMLAETVGRRRWGRALFRALNYYFSGHPLFAEYFEKYKPDLVFSTDNKHMLDTALLIEAKKRGVPTVSMVRSWDYLTAKGMVRVKPDALIVHNNIIKAEAEVHVDMSADTIHVVGMPHFDPYINTKRSSRESFCRKVGADPNKRLLLLAPVGEKFGDTDAELFELLDEAIHNGVLPADLQVLVRVPPGDDVPLSSALCAEHVLIDYPGETFGMESRKTNEMSYQDLLHLADSIHHSEVVLSSPSTMVIDAAAFDKPVIFFGFEGKRQKDYFDSFVHIYDYDHMVNLRKTGGALMARTPEDFFEAITYYLAHPDAHREERSRIVKEQCVALDGLASKRVADVLLAYSRSS